MSPSSLTFPRAFGVIAALVLTPLVSSAQLIYIDFGGAGATVTTVGGKSWNNVTSVGTMASPAALLDYNTNVSSGISYQVTDAFLATAGNGDVLDVEDFPATATRDSFYGDNSNALGQITFTGFDPGKQYTFTFLSSRDGVTDNRSTLFTLAGANTGSVAINSALATPVTGSIFSLTPSVSGTFVLDVTKDAANTNSSGFYYLSAMKIEVSSIPEPTTYAALLGTGVLGLSLFRRRR